MNIVSRKATRLSSLCLSNRSYHVTCATFKYSYLFDMADIKRFSDAANVKKMFQWFAHSPVIEVDRVNEADIWKAIGGSRPGQAGEKQKSGWKKV